MGAVNSSQRVKNTQLTYTDDLAKWKAEESTLRKKHTTNAWLRLALFVSAFVFPYFLTELWSASFFGLFAVFFFAFIGLVLRANKLAEKRKYVQKRIELIDKELRCASNNWMDEVDGADLIEPDHDYAHDLDLFGKGSLFQFINRTATNGAYLRLANKLKNISLSSSDVKAKQGAVEDLAGLNEYRQHFYALASRVEEENSKNRVFDLDKEPELGFVSRFIRVVIALFLFSISLVGVLVIFKVCSPSYLVYLFLLGLTITAFNLKSINRVHGEVTSLGAYLNRYSALIQHVEETSFSSSYLNEVKSTLGADGKKASEVMGQLASLIKRLDQRLNMLLGVVINGFFLWDLIVCVGLQRWYHKNGVQLSTWLNTLHELEAMNSLATFAYNHPNAIYPQLSDQIIFDAEGLGHPLIPDEERVCNSFSYSNQQRICVVTGANMAGKSTFLRTVGVALVMAGNGCSVVAKEFTYKPMVFITNMRAVDNLLKHESYFFAELNRLKMIVKRLKESGELFFILDEILKGTNSLDKLQGSMALIKQLLAFNGCGLVATHDLEIGSLAKTTNGQVFNNCFEVLFDDDGLEFDYQLKEGVTQSHNATFLMMKMGLIPKENVRR